MFDTWIYFVIILFISIYFLFFFKTRSNKLLDQFQKPVEHHPILGIIPFFLNVKRSDLLMHMCNWGDKYGSVVRLSSPFGTALIICKAEPAEKIFNSQTNLTKGFDYDYVRPWLGDGLLLSTGQKWNHRRKMLTPAFHFKILEDFLQVFNAESLKMVRIMRKEQKGGKTFDICHYVSRCTLDIICETAMGTSVNAQDVPDSDYIKSINAMGKLVQNRSFRPWLRFEVLWRLSSLYKEQEKVLSVLHGFTNKVIAERKKDLLKDVERNQTECVEKTSKEENIYFKTKKRLALLDLLLEIQKEKGEGELSDQDIREEVDTFMFEGHDTTATNTSFTIYALGCHPHIQEKVQEELNAIFGDDKERPVSTEDLTRMKYLECVIKESLRYYPSVPFIQRKLSSDIDLNDGRTMPEGVTVGIFLYKMHRDPEVFPNPTEFKPERFLAGNYYDPFAFVPFSAGPRNCVGQKFAIMEEKVMISSLMRNFTVKAMVPPEDLKLVSEMILRSEDGLPIQLKLR